MLGRAKEKQPRFTKNVGRAVDHVFAHMDRLIAFYEKKLRANKAATKMALAISTFLYVLSAILVFMIVIGIQDDFFDTVRRLLFLEPAETDTTLAWSQIPIAVLAAAVWIGELAKRRGYRRAWVRYAGAHSRILSAEITLEFEIKRLIDADPIPADLSKRAAELAASALAGLAVIVEDERKTWALDMQNDYDALQNWLKGADDEDETETRKSQGGTRA